MGRWCCSREHIQHCQNRPGWCWCSSQLGQAARRSLCSALQLHTSLPKMNLRKVVSHHLHVLPSSHGAVLAVGSHLFSKDIAGAVPSPRPISTFPAHHPFRGHHQKDNRDHSMKHLLLWRGWGGLPSSSRLIRGAESSPQIHPYGIQHSCKLCFIFLFVANLCW